MKKIITTIAIIALLATTAFAQNANTLRGSLSAGSAIPTTGGFGIGFDANIGWNIWDNLTAGLRYGAAIMINADGDEDGASVGAATNQQILATGTYFFNPGNSSFALFGGLGVGPYLMGDLNHVLVFDPRFPLGLVSGEVDGGAEFGLMLTAGFEVGRFRVAFEYHLVSNSDVRAVSDNTLLMERNNNFWGLSIGFTLGGGGRWGR